MKKLLFNENQLSLPLRESRSASLTLEHREKAFWFLVSVSLASLGVYFYAVSATAHHLAVRQNLEREVAEVNANLSSLEFSAIALKNNITLETAHQYGFAEVARPLYVSRNASPSLTFNTEAR